MTPELERISKLRKIAESALQTIQPESFWSEVVFACDHAFIELIRCPVCDGHRGKGGYSDYEQCVECNGTGCRDKIDRGWGF